MDMTNQDFEVDLPICYLAKINRRLNTLDVLGKS